MSDKTAPGFAPVSGEIAIFGRKAANRFSQTARAMLFCTGLFAVCAQASDTNLDANEHAVMFQKGADAFNVGKYDLCDDYWMPIARAGDVNAAYNMGVLFLKGYGVQKDPEEAMLWFEKAAEGGVIQAQNLLALLYIRGEYMPRDLKKAETLLNAAANAGDATAQYNLAVLYEMNDAAGAKAGRVYELYQYSAKAGNEKAALRLKDLPVPANDPENSGSDAELVTEAEKTAEADPENSDFGSGIELTRPKPLSADEKIDLFKKNEKKKPADEIGFESEIQDENAPVIFKQDEKKYDKDKRPGPIAYSPFDVSAPQNTPKPGETPEVKTDIFSLKEEAPNTAEKAFAVQNYKLAAELWQKRVTNENDPEAAYRLGGLYEKGLGVKQSSLAAYRFYTIGSLQSHAPSTAALEEISAKLTDAEMMRFEKSVADLY